MAQSRESQADLHLLKEALDTMALGKPPPQAPRQASQFMATVMEQFPWFVECEVKDDEGRVKKLRGKHALNERYLALTKTKPETVSLESLTDLHVHVHCLDPEAQSFLSEFTKKKLVTLSKPQEKEKEKKEKKEKRKSDSASLWE